MEDEESSFQEIRELAEQIARLNKQLVELGGFDNSRELLTCPKCRLYEDVTYSGILIVLESDASNNSDTGLRFLPISEDEWQCPKCDSVFVSEELIEDEFSFGDDSIFK